MRRLISLIVILMICTSLLLAGLRAAHSDPANTSCIQLLAPPTGEVLTIDVNTGIARLDARTAFPLPITEAPGFALLSPDRNLILNMSSASGQPFDAARLSLGRRSTTYQRDLTQQFRAYQYVWSPDSQHVAFVEVRGQSSRKALLNLVVADAYSSRIAREEISENLDDKWLFGGRQMLWSPDSTAVALALSSTNVAATLMLRAVTADQSLLVSLPNEEIMNMSWSPTSQVIFAVTYNAHTTQHSLYLVRADGQILKQIPLAINFDPPTSGNQTGEAQLQWSPDSQYLLVMGSVYSTPQLEIFTRDGDPVFKQPIEIVWAPSAIVWTDRPHTLFYFQHESDGEGQSLFALDVATQQTTALMTNLIDPFGLQTSLDQTLMAVTETRGVFHVVPHILSRDLKRNETPFGIIKIHGQFMLAFSPDSQKIMFVIPDDNNDRVVWRNVITGETQQADFPKPGLEDQLIASWVTNEVISLVKLSSGGIATILLLDAHSMQILPRFSPPAAIGRGYTIVWHDEHYAALASDNSMTLYRLSNGSIVFDNITSDAGRDVGTVKFSLAANEQAALLYRNYRNLSLITHNQSHSIVDADFVTLPAWSADGEAFTFAAIEKFKAGWTVKIMSRDGSLLHSFSLPAGTATTPYQQVRWTNCD